MRVKLHIFLSAALLIVSFNALAQSITVPTVAVDPGQTAQVSLDYVAGATITNLDFTITYDETVVDEDNIVIDCSPSIAELLALTCSVDKANNQVKGVGTNFTADELSATVGFAVASFPVLNSAAVGDSTNAFLANFPNVAGDIVSTQDTTWTLTVNPPPQPTFNATVTGEDPGNMGGEIGTTIESMIEVDNDSGEVGSILNYTCTISGGDVAKFSLTGNTTDFDVAQDGTHGFMTLACNSSELGTFATDLSCVHNDLPNTPFGDTVSCTVNEGPLPQFTGVDSGLSTMDVPEQGDADATATLTVTNSGDDGTTLIGECAYAGSSEISVTGGSFAVATGANAVVTATCSGAAEGSYDGTLTCGPTDPQTWVAADSPYAVHCDVGPPGDAVYSSDPAPGATIDMTPPGTPAVEDSDVADQFLVITNAAPEANDRDLVLINCGFEERMVLGSDAAGISASSVVSPLAPSEFTTVTFSCDTSEAGDYVETYRCGYDQDDDGVEDQTSPATYTVKCSVREPESDVSVSPASGTPLSINVAIGGSGQTSVRFGETIDEGLDGTLDDCSLDDDTYFSIVSDNDYPIMIPAGDFFDVVVQGFAPGDPSIQASAVLTCEYSDSDSDGDEASWPINIVVMSAAIPTLSTWSLLAMILALMGLAGVAFRRRNNM